MKRIIDITTDAQLTNEELKTKTQKCFARIKASIDPKGHVVDTLFEKGVFTREGAYRN